MIPAVIYARYSSSNQREESIAGQLRECHAFADRNGYKIIEEYTDSAMTGKTDKRPGFQKMIKDSEKRTFEAVIVWKLDRFARDRYDAAVYRKILRENGVKLISAMEAISDSPEGIILEGLLEAMAEYYSANLSENIKRGTYDSALERKYLGKKTLGYRRGSDGRYEIDPDTAPIVKRIFREYLEGRPRQEIIDGLNADGFKTAKGNAFANNSLYSILRNDKYIGVYRYMDIVDPQGIPPIISKEDFEETQRRMKKRAYTKRNISAGYSLASKIYCGECGSAMTGESARSKNGEIYLYYSCVGRKGKTRNGCDMPRIRKEWIETKMIRIVNDLILTDETIEMFVDAYRKSFMEKSEDPELTIMKNELKDVVARLENVLRAIESGAWSEALNSRLRELEEKKDELNIRIEEKGRERPPVTPEMVRDYFLGLREKAKTDDECQQILMDVFLRRVWLFKPQKKDGLLKAVFEISVNGTDGDPAAYQTMLDLCSSELSQVETSTQVSNTSIISYKSSLFLVACLLQ